MRPLVRLNVSLVAESNGRREAGSFGFGGRYLYDDLFDEGRLAHIALDAVEAMLGGLPLRNRA